MTGLAHDLDLELAKVGVTVFGAVEIVLPSHTLRLLDGAGRAVINGSLYTGRDATYGVLASVDTIGDGIDDSAPAARITLMPPSETATAILADPAAQGGQVTLLFGAIDAATGLVIADPYVVFVGELDVATVMVDQNERSLQYDVVSVFERLFDQDEGVRLNGPWHASIWPGELGLQYVSAIQQQMPWGADGPRPTLITDVTPALSPGIAGAGNGWAGFRPGVTYF